MTLIVSTILLISTQISKIYASYDLWYQCAKLYKPQNYLESLPHLNMPYVPKVPMPNNQDRIFEFNKNQKFEKIDKIQPTPTLTTKVISFKTKYIYKNPICVKYSKKKKYCTPQSVKKREDVDKLVTKEVFFRQGSDFEMAAGGDNMADEGKNLDYHGHGFSLMQPEDLKETDDRSESSMEPRLSTLPAHSRTPHLTARQINDLLIEDRLDQLETILPNYSRRRKYETSTVYVTKVVSNKRNMATLVVQNCIPQGYQICPQKNKKRKSKVARFSDQRDQREEEEGFYYG